MSKVWLARTAYTQLLEEALRKMPLETGGILLGYRSSGEEIIVTTIAGPGPKAGHRTNSFVPDDAYHRQAIRQHYQQSGRTEVYLGDWHTHPYAAAYLSERDKKTLRKIADFEFARLPNPLMLIIGTRPFQARAWTHACAEGRCGRGSTLIECDLNLY